MRLPILLIFALLFSFKATSTPQVCHNILYLDNNQIAINSPLNSAPNQKALDKLFRKHISSACWQGYNSNWVLKDSCLFLKNINTSFGGNLWTRFNGNFTDPKNVTRKVSRITKSNFQNGLMVAHWFNDTIWYSNESIIVDTSRSEISWMWPYLDYVSLENIGLVFRNGRLIKTLSVKYKPCDNFIGNYHNYIYSRINWDSISNPKLIFEIVKVVFEYNEYGEPTYCKASCANEAYEREIERVIMNTPCFDVFYRRGKFCCNKVSLNVQISAAIRQKYKGKTEIR